MAAPFLIIAARPSTTLAEKLVLLLRAWRARKLTRTAELVVRVSELLGRPAHAKTGAGWRALAERGDAADLDWLMDHVVVPSRVKASVERLARMRRRPDDPRIALRLLGILSKGPFRSESGRTFHLALLRELRRRADPSLLPALEALLASPDELPFDARVRKELRAVADTIAATPAPEPFLLDVRHLDDVERSLR